MDELAARFERNRPHLHAVAYRMLGSHAEADDAVQETWLRLARSDDATIDNLAGWLTTVVSRVALDMLRSRSSRREEPLDKRPEAVAHDDPQREAELADAVGTALLVVLDTLAPAERLAFVLHDLFAVSFDEIADIVRRTPAAARQLASRARRRVQGASTPADRARQRAVVEAFRIASREGDFAALFAVLDRDVVVRADGTAAAMGAEAEIRGRDAVAGAYNGRARAARPATVDGVPGLVWTHRGTVQVVFDFTVVDGHVAAIELVADPEVLAAMEISFGRD